MIPLNVNGAVFEYPETFDESWGVDATGWAQAVTNGMLQRQGGSFPLTADVNFGASFGLLASYFKTRAVSPAASGLVRLSVADFVAWRNNANSADLPLAVNGFDQLTFNGAIVSTSAAAVTAIIGTANQVLANGTSGSLQTGNVTLTTPQAIAPSSSPTFAGLTLTGLLSSTDITPTMADTSILGSVSKPWLSVTTDQILLHKPGFGQLNINPNAAQTSYSLFTPAAQGGAGTLLQNDGSGNLSFSGQDLNANSHKLINLANGTSPADAVNFGQLSLYLPLAGGTMSGAINMGANQVNNVADGVAATDAVTVEQVRALCSYRRPVLQYNSSTLVNVETGLDGTANELTILFPDLTIRKDSTSNRIILDLTRVAALSGSWQSGIRTGFVIPDSWYAVYAVKTTDNANHIVIVADTTLPTQANYASLNGFFGTNGWVYLGMIAYGDGAAIANAVVSFVMAGNRTQFNNTVNDPIQATAGIRLAQASSTATVTWTYASGTNISSAQLPSNILLITVGVHEDKSGATGYIVTDSSGTRVYAAGADNANDGAMAIFPLVATEGVKAHSDGGALTNGFSITLQGFVDGVLGVGSNPLL